MNNYLGYYNVKILNNFLKKSQFEAMQKNRLFLLFSKVFIKAVPIMGPGSLQPICLKSSVYLRIHLEFQKALK